MLPLVISDPPKRAGKTEAGLIGLQALSLRVGRYALAHFIWTVLVQLSPCLGGYARGDSDRVIFWRLLRIAVAAVFRAALACNESNWLDIAVPAMFPGRHFMSLIKMKWTSSQK
jgi:hypothetical protein